MKKSGFDARPNRNMTRYIISVPDLNLLFFVFLIFTSQPQLSWAQNQKYCRSMLSASDLQYDPTFVIDLQKILKKNYNIQTRLKATSNMTYVIDQNSAVLGYLFFSSMESGVVTISKMNISNSFLRTKGLSTLLIHQLLTKKNRTFRIVIESLGEQELLQYYKSLELGLSPENAIKKTPAFKAFKKFGFRQVSQVNSISGGFTLEIEKDR